LLNSSVGSGLDQISSCSPQTLLAAGKRAGAGRMIGFGRDRIDEGDLKVSGSISSSGKLGTSSMCLFRICNRQFAIVSFVYQSNTAPVHQGLVMLL